ncbi:MAG TPA: DUF4157 domain-containing protein [Pyrinomonadaceae bacterium]|nr:DUF4157 domain-containing protein [Pyrinomonadaceae bacterium]
MRNKLQRAVGNQSTLRILRARAIQPKDELPSDFTPITAGGSPLSSTTRAWFEPRFGHDFSGVRVHTGPGAADSASAVNAQAYTVGNNIVFNRGEYRPGTATGNHLLAHELAHVVQQNTGVSASVQRRTYQTTTTAVAFERGPLWNVRLTVTNAPEEDTDDLNAFVYDCLDGIMAAVRELGERPGVTTRNIRVRIRFNRRLSERDIEQRAYDLAIASLPRTRAVTQAAQPARPRATHIPADASEEPRPTESTDQRIRREANATIRQMANTVADADVEGYNRVVFNIENNGRGIILGLRKEQQAGSGGGHTSAYNVRDFLSVYVDQFTSGRGRWQIIYTRQGNALSFSSFERVPEAPPPSSRSEEDELRALGIPNRREIYSQIFQQAERELRDAGIMLATFGIEQLVLWVVGGVLFRAVGLLGRAAFPKILALIGRGTPAALDAGLQVLNAAERTEFAALMQRVESGALSAAERVRLNALLQRVEAALPNSLIRTAAGLVGRIRIPRVASLRGSAATLDAEMVRRAAEIRATQAGLTLDAFSSLNVAVARVRTASGEIVYLEAGNLPAGAHSEEYLLGQFRDRALGLGQGARIEQLYSERIPCSNCSDVIRRYFGQDVEIYYTVGNQPNRGELLMQAYGL